MATMKLVKIKTLGGIEDLEFAPGKYNEIRGGNGRGKTSLLRALGALLGGGRDVRLLRNGEDEGEAYVELQGGDQLRARWTPKGSTLTLRNPVAGTKTTRPQEWLDGHTDAFALDPLELLNPRTTKARRIEIVVRAVPMTLPASDLVQACGPTLDEATLKQIWAEDEHALVVVDRAEQLLFKRRTGVNATAADKRATADQLTVPLAPPAELTADWEGIAGTLQQELDKVNDERAMTARSAELDESKAVACHRAVMEDRIRQARDDFEERSRAAAKVRQQRIDAAHEVHAGKSAELRQRLGEASVKAQAAAGARRQAQLRDQMVEASTLAEGQALKLTTAINNLRDLRRELASDLPIKGLEIMDGELRVAGVDFDLVNTAEQIRVAVELLRLGARQLGEDGLKVGLVDGLEHLEPKNRELVKQEMLADDITWFVTLRTEGELAVVSAP